MYIMKERQQTLSSARNQAVHVVSLGDKKKPRKDVKKERIYVNHCLDAGPSCFASALLCFLLVGPVCVLGHDIAFCTIQSSKVLT